MYDFRVFRIISSRQLWWESRQLLGGGESLKKFLLSWEELWLTKILCIYHNTNVTEVLTEVSLWKRIHVLFWKITLLGILLGILFLHNIFFPVCVLCACSSVNFSFYFISDTVIVVKEKLQAGIGQLGCWHAFNLSVNALGYRRVVEYELILSVWMVNVNLTLPISQFSISDLMRFVIKSSSFK